MKKSTATFPERPFLLRFAGLLTLLFTALLPLKFGITFLSGEPGAFPEGVLGWVLTPWTMPLFAVGAGIVLAMVLIGSWTMPWILDRRQPLFWVAVLWMLLPVVGALGLIRASSLAPGLLQLTEFFGLTAYALAVLRLLTIAPEYRMRLLIALAVGLVLTAAAGWYQYWFGFEEMRKFVLTQEQAGKLQISDDLKARIWDTRVAATFTFAGNLAGALLTAAPAAILLFWLGGRKMDPPRLSAWLLAGAGCVLFGFVFWHTKGRSAFLAGLLAVKIYGWLRLPRRRDRVLLALAVLAVIAAGWMYVHFAGRGFSSLVERVGYWKSSTRIFSEEPWLGTGWGDFPHRHALFKDMGNHELAKDPHNLPASFTVACGAAGLLYALFLLLVPWGLALRKQRAAGWPLGVDAALFFGLTGFIFYAQADPVLQIPALVSFCALMQILLLAPDPAATAAPGKECCRRCKQGLGILIALTALLLGLWQTAADRALEKLQTCSGSAVGSVNIGSRQTVTAALKKAAALRPYDDAPWICAGKAAMIRREFDLAERCFLEAQRRSPEAWNIPLELARVRFAQGRIAEAERDYAEAKRRFPHNDRIPALDPGRIPSGKE